MPDHLLKIIYWHSLIEMDKRKHLTILSHRVTNRYGKKTFEAMEIKINE